MTTIGLRIIKVEKIERDIKKKKPSCEAEKIKLQEKVIQVKNIKLLFVFAALSR